MLCRNPFVPVGGIAYGCGQCLPCRFNRRRVWSHRLLLEKKKWTETAFITLTYSDEFLPLISNTPSTVVATLVPEHLRDWLKRLRWALSPAKIKFYAVGEYGRDGLRSKTWNPHYHAIVFGVCTCEYGDSNWCSPRVCRCTPCKLFARTWSFGRVHAGTVTDKSIQYVAGYIVQKLRTEVRDDLGKRVPEFSRMSLRPGIGVTAVQDVARGLRGARLENERDVPTALRHGRTVLPLGRTLVRKLRKELGRDEVAPVEEIGNERQKKMYALQLDAEKNKISFKEALVKDGEQKVRQLVARNKIRERKRS